ncbi:MAG: putative nucleotide binding protein [Natronomonas sp.]|jgi:putative nucleotide binding protein
MSNAGEEGEPTTAVLLDFMPRGRPEDDRPQYQKSPVAFALGESDFRLVEIALADDAHVNIGDRVQIDPPGENIKDLTDIEYEDLSSTAQSELEYAVDTVIDADEQRFVDFYNDAQPITTRLHVLNLLPGIGKKLRNNILDARKRKPFESFEDVEDRVSGLHNPREVLVERILEELQKEDLKYRIFARREAE